MEEYLRASLLGSIAADRLVIIAGAGLSMAAPTRLPSARDVSRICFDKYAALINDGIPPDIRDNLEEVAEWAKQHVNFGPVFVRNIVPWNLFTRTPNAGHDAVADLVLSRAVAACLTSNYENHVERCGYNFCAPFPIALDGVEATATQGQSPYLKFHGCEHRDKDRTIWAPSQFQTDPCVAARKQSCELWITNNLQQKDLLFVGFWSDWAYLNRAISLALSNVHPVSVTLVDPCDELTLQQKAPDLWALAHKDGVIFRHVPQSGAEFLDALRREFSAAYLRELVRIGEAAFLAQRPQIPFEAQWREIQSLTSTQFYSWRRDAEGKSPNEPAAIKFPAPTCEAAAFAHILLRAAGWTMTPTGYEKNGQTARVINAAGRFLNDVKRRFVEAPAVIESDIIICAGATDIAVPSDIVRDSDPANIIRGGSASRWFDLPTSIQELAL